MQVFLSLVLALNKLAKAASNKAQEDRETVITSRHIASVAPVSPQESKSLYCYINPSMCLGHTVKFERIATIYHVTLSRPLTQFLSS